LRIVAVADSDSYVKWGAALLGALPAEWERELLVVDSQFEVNDEQLRTALRDTGIVTGERVSHVGVAARLRESAPDAVLVAAPGPVSMVMIRLVAEIDPRPVILAGLPGISIPVTVKALRFRRQADLMIVHSHREVREFGQLALERGWDHRLGLARIPFASDHPVQGTDLVFAAQAVVPCDREDRLHIADLLREAALADPTRRVIVKLRARAGERSTHPEKDAYPDLVRELGEIPPNLMFATGAMATALDTAEGLVTVSSTSLLEAVARGIPAIAIDDFGVDDKLINPVFEGSGLFGGARHVIARRFRHPDPSWLGDNYFHPAQDDDWIASLDALVGARREGRLAPRPAHLPTGGRLRAAWDRKQAFGPSDRSFGGLVALLVGVPARAVVRLRRRVAARLSSRGSLSASAG